MLYWMTQFADGGGIFNLFKYITFRAGCAFITALIFGFIFGQPLINLLRRKQGKGQPIREDGPQSHLSKAGTPTMGGLLILSALVFATLVWARLDNPYIWIVLLVTLAFGGIGFADDYAKVTKQTTKGVSSRIRMLLGLLIAGLAAYAASSFHPADLTGQLALPVFKDALVNLGWFYVPFGMFVIVGSANAVNLTDGLDGLAAGCGAIVFTGLGIQLMLRGHEGDPAMAYRVLGRLDPGDVIPGARGDLELSYAYKERGFSTLGEQVEPTGRVDHTFEMPELGITVAYHRDRGESLDPARIDKSLLDFIQSDVEEFGYVMTQSGEWMMIDGYRTIRELKHLETILSLRLA